MLAIALHTDLVVARHNRFLTCLRLMLIVDINVLGCRLLFGIFLLQALTYTPKSYLVKLPHTTGRFFFTSLMTSLV